MTPARIHGYIRVSTDEQAVHGASLPAQKNIVERYADLLIARDPRLTMGTLYIEEGVSASKVPLIQRPKGRRLCQSLAPGDHIVFSRLDRCFRSLSDFVTTFPSWQAKGIVVHFANLGVDLSTPEGRMIVNLLATIAQWESELIGQRTKEALHQRRRDGRVTGTVPFGYRREGDILVPRRDHWVIGRYVRRLRNKGMTLTDISDKLETILAKRGNRPYAPAVHFKLRREWTALRLNRLCCMYESVGWDWKRLCCHDYPHHEEREQWRRKSRTKNRRTR